MRYPILVAAFLLAQVATATPSGLNNIATADTMDAGKAAFQLFGVFAEKSEATFISGVKVGFKPFDVANLEVGVDSRLSPSPSGPVLFQAKVSRWTVEGGPTVAVGFANFTLGDKDRIVAGKTAGYLAVAQPIRDILRIHAGYQLQSSNNAFFAGADKSFKLGGRDFTACADLTQVGGQTDWLVAPGVKYSPIDRLVLEAWMSYATSAKTVSGVFKIDIII